VLAVVPSKTAAQANYNPTPEILLAWNLAGTRGSRNNKTAVGAICEGMRGRGEIHRR